MRAGAAERQRESGRETGRGKRFAGLSAEREVAAGPGVVVWPRAEGCWAAGLSCWAGLVRLGLGLSLEFWFLIPISCFNLTQPNLFEFKQNLNSTT